jgi:hypothetical protein
VSNEWQADGRDCTWNRPIQVGVRLDGVGMSASRDAFRNFKFGELHRDMCATVRKHRLAAPRI